MSAFRTRTLSAVALSVAAATIATAHPPLHDGEYERAADMTQLGDWVTMEQSFSDAKREEARAAIAGHLEKATDFSEAGFYMEVRRIVALANNGHSNVSTAPIHRDFGLLPLRTYWFSDGLYVVRVRKPQAELLGARIEAIEGRPLAELETRLMRYTGGSLEYFHHYSAGSLMLSPALMHAVGLAQSPDRLTLRVRNRAGEEREVALEVDFESSAVQERPWRYLNPAPIEGAADWSAIHAPSAEAALYLGEEEEMFRYVLLEDGDIAYLQLRANRGSGRNSVEYFWARAQERLQQDRPRSIVLDNRQNPGGDLTRTADFALELPSFAQDEGRVYVLTGNGTFSAGIYTSFFPKASDPERTLIVGELVGDWPRFWAETGAPFGLEGSGYGIGYALQMHDLVNGCPEPIVCHMAQHPAHWNIAVETLDPDWPVPTTFADFEAGRDPVLEAVLQHEVER